MSFRTHFPAVAAGLLTCFSSLSVSSPGTAGEINPPSPATGTNIPPATIAVEEALRQIKEQQAAASQALELILDHTETALHRNAVTVSNQLAQFSVALSDYSDRQFQLMRSTESRTLRVTLSILLVVVLTASALLLLAARALRSLAHRYSAAPVSLEAPASPPAMLEQNAEAAYSAAILDVEKRIAALEHRPLAASVPLSDKVQPPTASTQGPRVAASAKLRSSGPLALAVGSGEALMFLPRDQSPAGDRKSVSALGRLGRLFQRGSPPKSARD